MEAIDTLHYRAAAGNQQEFGATPQEALNALMARLREHAPTPIVIWPCNRGDAYSSDAQQERLRKLRSRRDTLNEAEHDELERLIEAAFDATIDRTQSMPVVKS